MKTKTIPKILPKALTIGEVVEFDYYPREGIVEHRTLWVSWIKGGTVRGKDLAFGLAGVFEIKRMKNVRPFVKGVDDHYAVRNKNTHEIDLISSSFVEARAYASFDKEQEVIPLPGLLRFLNSQREAK
jgi:hypothetical protein